MGIQLSKALVLSALSLAACSSKTTSEASAAKVEVVKSYSACSNWISLNAKKVGRIQDIEESMAAVAKETCPRGYDTSGALQNINGAEGQEVVLGIRCRSVAGQKVAEIPPRRDSC